MSEEKANPTLQKQTQNSVEKLKQAGKKASVPDGIFHDVDFAGSAVDGAQA